MAQVTVTIAGKTYRMACDDGQEEHLVGLASRLDANIDELRSVFGEIGDQRLTVMSAITLMDKLVETERRIAGLEADLDGLRSAHETALARQAEVERRIAARVAEAAERIGAAAGKLDTD